MRGLVDKLALFFVSLLLIPPEKVSFETAALSVSVFVICCVTTVIDRRWARIAAAVLFFVMCMFYPQTALLVAPIAYTLAESRDKKQMLCILPAVVLSYIGSGLRMGLCVTAYVMLADVLCNRRLNFEDKDNELKFTRDSGVENSLVLMERNKRLIEQQNNEINMATLKERNRIAREIHDNVGHVLSRSLLQLGAVMAVTKNDEKMTALLQPVRESMDLALDSIRNSVHDLRDDSIDLKTTAEEILKPLEGSYKIYRQYDFSYNVDKDIKLCFIAVLKEAVTNIIRHSDADTVSVTMTEHPTFMQLVVDDNGKSSKRPDSEGMGLSNIRERVKMLDGIINITTTGGFRIFITIPKQNDKENEHEDNSSR